VLLCFTEPTQTSLVAIPVDSKQSEEKERFISALVFHRNNSNEKTAMFCADMSLESHESALTRLTRFCGCRLAGCSLREEKIEESPPPRTGDVLEWPAQ